MKAAERIEVAHADGILRIHTPEAENRTLGASGSVEVTVRLPAGSRTEAKAALAEFRGDPPGRPARRVGRPVRITPASLGVPTGSAAVLRRCAKG